MKKSSRQRTFPKTGIVLVTAIFCVLLFLLFFWKLQKPLAPDVVEAPVSEPKLLKAQAPSSRSQNDLGGRAQAGVDDMGRLIPKPMKITTKVLLSKEWNSAADALSRDEPPEGMEGSSQGPHSVAYVNDTVYVLDSVKNRLLGYDKEGRLVSTVALPNTRLPADLVVNPSDSSLFVIDQYEQNIYKVKDGQATLIQSIPLKDFSLGEKFGYDAVSGTLYINSPERHGDVALMVNGQVVDLNSRTVQQLSPVTGDFEGNDNYNILLNLKGGQDVRIRFGTPVQCVEEVTMDRNGIVWFLYTLEGDYRMYRLARVDLTQGTVGTADIDNLWYAHDGVRRMTVTENGVVVVAGDNQTGSVLSFEYAGSPL